MPAALVLAPVAAALVLTPPVAAALVLAPVADALVLAPPVAAERRLRLSYLRKQEFGTAPNARPIPVDTTSAPKLATKAAASKKQNELDVQHAQTEKVICAANAKRRKHKTEPRARIPGKRKARSAPLRPLLKSNLAATLDLRPRPLDNKY